MRFLVEKGVAAIPSTSNQAYQKENLAIFDFELSADEMEALRQYALVDEAAAASGGEDAEAAGAASAHEDTPSPQEAAAAVAVQAAARGKQVREEKRLASEFEADMQRVREERQAATAVQAASRGKQARSSKR